ncbi:uncharacterized protein LOC120428577 [Culex pipiens pallens]|uniref:uncharacterized protein LOC120428577 n=1 Tax=Culex pipiens pallens TaxID=42434 RepID=UPI001954EEA7|nr:uncharacterized protein LOC120428577 [Culex pipiens pallens]
MLCLMIWSNDALNDWEDCPVGAEGCEVSAGTERVVDSEHAGKAEAAAASHAELVEGSDAATAPSEVMQGAKWFELNINKQKVQHSMPPRRRFPSMPPFHHLGMVLPRPLPGFSGIMNQPPLMIPVNISPPFNMVPHFPPLHLLQANVPS